MKISAGSATGPAGKDILKLGYLNKYSVLKG